MCSSQSPVLTGVKSLTLSHHLHFQNTPGNFTRIVLGSHVVRASTGWSLPSAARRAGDLRRATAAQITVDMDAPTVLQDLQEALALVRILR